MAQNTFTDYTLTQVPRWRAEPRDPDTLMPGGFRVDPAQFNATDAVVVTVAAGGAAIGATSVPVAALSGPIPNGTVLDFGTGKFATLTAAALAGATTLTVRAIPTALVAGDVATYAGLGRKTISSGTLVGRTFAERDAGTNFGPAVSTDDVIYIVDHDIVDATLNPEFAAYKPGHVVKENYLPGYATMAGALLTQVRSRYVTQKGVN